MTTKVITTLAVIWLSVAACAIIYGMFKEPVLFYFLGSVFAIFATLWSIIWLLQFLQPEEESNENY